MQRQAAEDLKRLVTNALVERDLALRGRASFVTPRRLDAACRRPARRAAAIARGAQGPARRRAGGGDPGISEERGPARIEDAAIEKDPKKGEFYVAVIEKPGRDDEASRSRRSCPRSSARFPWPKSMRWGAASARPTRRAGCAAARIVCTLASQHDAPEIVAFEVDGSAAGDTTWGHRFMAPAPIRCAASRLCRGLSKAKVVLDADVRCWKKS